MTEAIEQNELAKAFDVAAASFFVGDAGESQLELFDAAGEVFFKKVQQKPPEEDLGSISRNPEYTLSTLKKHFPEKYNLAVWCRLSRYPLRKTAKLLAVSPNTIGAVDRYLAAHPDVDTVREMISSHARYLSGLTLERIEEYLQETKVSDLDIGKLANLTKALELVAGNPTERHQHSHEWTAPVVEKSDYEDFIEAEVVEMHPGDEKICSHDGTAVDPAADPEPPDGPGTAMPADHDQEGS